MFWMHELRFSILLLIAAVSSRMSAARANIVIVNVIAIFKKELHSV